MKSLRGIGPNFLLSATFHKRLPSPELMQPSPKSGRSFTSLSLDCLVSTIFSKARACKRWCPSFLPGGVIWVYHTGAWLICRSHRLPDPGLNRCGWRGSAVMSLFVADRVGGPSAGGVACSRQRRQAVPRMTNLIKEPPESGGRRVAGRVTGSKRNIIG